MSVALWVVALDAPELADGEYESCLSAQERQRALKLRVAQDRKRFTITRSALRHILAGAVNLNASEIKFEYSPGGKPEILSDAGWSFSVSHSGDRALIALTQRRRVGVDVEQMTHSYAQLQDVARTLDRHQRDALALLPAEAAAKAFYRAWVRREAMLKALGIGIARRPVAIDPSPWHLVEIDGTEFASPGYVAALAVEREARHVVLRRWP